MSSLIITVMIIPIRMLWNMQVKARQKLAIGTALCLSIAMIITCIVRLSCILTSKDIVDVSWEVFWQLAEACIAVLMVSLTALRSVFIGKVSRARPATSWSSRQARYWLRNKVFNRGSEETDRRLPDIPRATLTGIRTFIRGGEPRSAMWSEANVETGAPSGQDVLVCSNHTEDPWCSPPLELTPLPVTSPLGNRLVVQQGWRVGRTMHAATCP